MKDPGTSEKSMARGDGSLHDVTAAASTATSQRAEQADAPEIGLATQVVFAGAGSAPLVDPIQAMLKNLDQVRETTERKLTIHELGGVYDASASAFATVPMPTSAPTSIQVSTPKISLMREADIAPSVSPIPKPSKERVDALRSRGASLLERLMTGEMPPATNTSHQPVEKPLDAPATRQPVASSSDEVEFEPVDDDPAILSMGAGQMAAPESALEELALATAGITSLLAIEQQPAPELAPPPAEPAATLSVINAEQEARPTLSTASPTARSTSALVDAETSAVPPTGHAKPISPTQVESPRAAEPIVPAAQAVSSGDSINFDPLYVAMSESRNRNDSVVKMVEWFAKLLPTASVRCGLGGSRLRRFFDARLGWLGSESVLQRTMAANWRSYLGENAASHHQTGRIVIRLNWPGHNQVAILSIEGDRATPALLDAIKPHETAISAVLWGRPRLSLPEWSATRGRPRMAIAAATVMVVLLLLCPVPYPASCSVVVEPVGSRVVSSPFAGTLEDVLVEPGDQVTAGQIIATLDGRPLRLEQQSLDAEIQQARKQQDVALAVGKVADAQLAQLKGQQLARRRDLLTRRLGQLSVTSPIDGVVVAGDLKRTIGAPLESGQVLFEVASLDRVVLEVEIPEREIGLVESDSPVQWRVEAARSGNVDSVLSKIYPMAQIREDQSVFVAPIEISNPDQRYRPGMRGKATVFGPVRPWVWRHIRGVVEQIAWLARW